MNRSIFQTIFLVILGLILAVAVLIFAGVLPGFRTKKIGVAGNVKVWSSFSSNNFSQIMTNLGSSDNENFSLTYAGQGADLETSLVNALASGQGPDVIIAPHELIIKHRDKFSLIPFATIPLRSYQETFVDEASLFVEKEGIMALPLAIDPLLLYYNKDLYKNAGLISAPANWEKFVEIQPALTKTEERSRLTQSAFALGAFSNINNAKDILSLFILQAGGSPVNFNNGKITITLDNNFGFTLKPAESALSFFLQFADPLKSTYCWNRSLPEARDSFLGESLANYFGFASEASYLTEKNPHLNFDLSLVPQMTGENRMTFGRLYGIAVLKSSTKKSAAWSMAFALAGEKFSKESVEALNFAPVRRSLLIPDPAKPNQKIVFDAALISRGWFDFSSTETKNIFQTMSENVSSGRLNVAVSIAEATGEMGALLNQP